MVFMTFLLKKLVWKTRMNNFSYFSMHHWHFKANLFIQSIKYLNLNKSIG